MRFTPLVLAAALVSAGVPAYADVLTFGSYVGSSAMGLSNGPVTYSNTTGTGAVVGYDNPAYGPAFSGTQYISYTTSTNAASNYTTAYTTEYTGDLTGASGSLSLFVDNSAAVYLNGVLEGSYGGFSAPGTLTLSSGDFVNGINTLTFDVLNDNTGGPTAFDFSATVTTTPEPSSVLLIGTGLLGLAGTMRKRGSLR